MIGKSLNISPRYRSFVTARDQALESILGKYLHAMDLTVSAICRRIQEIVSYHASRGQIPTVKITPRLEQQIDQVFSAAHGDFAYLFHRMRISVYTLAHAGEAQSMARALGKTQKIALTRQAVDQQIGADAPSGGSVPERIDLALHRLKSKVIQAVKLSVMLEEKPAEMLARIEKAFPKKTKYQIDPRVLKRVKEAAASPIDLMSYALGGRAKLRPVQPDAKADQSDQPTLTTGTIDPDAWQTMLDDYQSDQIPGPRGPYDKMVLFDVGQDGSVAFQERYEWELEQEITQDFIQQVRDGQVDAANENGISEFMWIAVIDSHTDDCCAGRDGLSSSEIESRLKDGKLDPGDSDSSVPPAHFNCRCTLAPISQDLPEESPPDFGSFDDWINEKAAA